MMESRNFQGKDQNVHKWLKIETTGMNNIFSKLTIDILKVWWTV